MPFFSVVTPVYNPPVDALQECIKSMKNQTFTDWEWCVVDDQSTDKHVQSILQRAMAKDSRIRVALRSTNGGIVEASQDALDMAAGEFVGLLDHDDALDPEALAKVAATLLANPDADYIYTDEDKINPQGQHYGVFRKPPFDLVRLRGQNYCCHFSVFRKTLLDDIGGFRSGFDGSQDYDLILRATERARLVVHIPEVLYHWRVVPGSTSGDSMAKPYAFEAGQRALEQHFERVGIQAEVATLNPGSYSHTFTQLPTSPLVSIVIPTTGAKSRVWGVTVRMIEHLVANIVETTTYENYEIIVVDDLNAHPGYAVPFGQTDDGSSRRISVVGLTELASFFEMCNIGYDYVQGETVIFMDENSQVMTPAWIEQFLGQMIDSKVGIVGPMILMGDGRIESCGISLHPSPHRIAWSKSSRNPGVWGSSAVARIVSGVTDTCFAVRQSVFHELGGFSPEFQQHGADLDFCCKARDLSYSTVWTPTVRVTHFGTHHDQICDDPEDLLVLARRWKRYLDCEQYSLQGKDRPKQELRRRMVEC
jgi:glycosyltransferase involved in cell wall biosynthesis